MDQKSLLRTLTINYDQILVPYINAYQAAGKFPKEWTITIPNFKESDGHFHPSSHCFASPRDLYLDIKGLTSKPKPSAALRRTFDCGHMWHGYLEEMLHEMSFVSRENIERYIVKEMEGPYGSFVGAGTGDLVDVEIPNKGSWLVDIKTMNKGEFESGANKFTFMKWEAQVNCYMDWLGAEQAMVLAVCKDSPHNMREYTITRKQDLLDEIYDRWSYTAKCLFWNTLPEDDYTPLDPLLLNPGDSVFDATLVENNTLTT